MDNSIVTLAKVQDVEFITKFTRNMDELLTILRISEPITKSPSTTLKMYKTEGTLSNGSIAPGQNVPASDYSNKVTYVDELAFSKYRKQTTLEDVSQNGFGQAVDITDGHMMADIQGTIMTDFFDVLKKGTTTVSGENLQSTMAKARGALRKAHASVNFTPITFISVDDLTDYLSKSEITLQNTFGLYYIEQFLNIGLTIEDPTLPKGTMYSTSAENIFFYYCDPAQAEGFEFYTDETGIIGIKHEPTYINEAFQTHAVCAAKFFPLYSDRIVKGTIGSAGGSSRGSDKTPTPPPM